MEGTRLQQNACSMLGMAGWHGGKGWLSGGAMGALCAVASYLMMIGTAGGSDFFQACRSADGLYVMEGEALREMNPVSGESDGKSLEYKVLSRVSLSRREGYCVGMGDPSKRYGHRAETYLLDVSFQSEEGQRRRAYLLCEEASDGLPASENCARQVTTQDWRRRFKGADAAPQTK